MKLYKDSCYTVASATLVVAASDSLHKERADYVCSGANDDVTIQQAINALPTDGGIVYLSEGHYVISNTIVLRKGVALIGTGEHSTTINLADNSNCDMIAYGQTDAISSFIKVKRMFLNGNKANQTSGHGINIYKVSHTVKDCIISEVYINSVKQTGIRFEHVWGGHIDHCNSESNDEYGYHLHAEQTYINDCYGSGCDDNFRTQGSQIFLTNCHSRSGSSYGFSVVSGAENHFTNCQDYGSVKGFYCSGTPEFCIFTNCLVKGTGNRAYDLNTLENSQFIGCIVEGAGGIWTYGFYIRGTAKNILISECIINNCTYPIKVDGSYPTTYIYSNQCIDLFMDVLAVSATHVRSNEDLSVATPITFTITAQPDIPRTLLGHFDSHAQITEYDIEIIGVDAKGNTITETKDETDGWDWETNNAFATITSIKMTSRTGTGAGDTMDIGITDVLGLSNIIYKTSDVFKIKKNNANATVATAQVNTTYDTYDMAVIGLAATDDFTLWYKSNLNIIS